MNPEPIPAEIVSLSPLRIKTWNEFGNEPKPGDYISGCAYAGCTGEINGCQCMSRDHKQWQQAENNRREFLIVEQDDDKFETESLADVIIQEKIIAASEPYLAGVRLGIECGYQAHKSAKQFSLDDMRKCFEYAYNKGLGGDKSFDISEKEIDDYIQSLHPQYKLGDKVTIIPVSDNEATIVTS